MVQIQFLTRVSAVTVLTGTLVSRIDIVAAEANLPFRNSIVTYQENDSRHPDNAVNQSYRLVPHRDGEITPAIEVKGLILRVNGFCNPLIKEDEGTTHRSDMDGKIGPIEDQDLGIEHGIARCC